MTSADTVKAARARAFERLQERAEGIERRRTRRFLVAQTTIVLVISFGAAGIYFTGVAPDAATFYRSMAVCVTTLVVTLVGWLVFRRGLVTTSLVIGLLYADSAIGVAGYYVMGEYETPNLACVVLLVVMAPLFSDSKRHAWGIATFQLLLYVVMLFAREWDVIPYGWVFPMEAFDATRDQYSTFFADSILGFFILVYGAAFLAGEASLGMLSSQAELESEVDAATARLARANVELQERNRALDEFNAALSHDLKSPLQTALLAAEAMIYGSPRLTPGQMELAETIAQSTGRMGDLTRELLRLSRMSDELEKWEDVELEGMVEQVVADLGGRIRASGARIRIEEPLPVALGNASLLREALQNLIENGIKYGAPGRPEVLVRNANAPWGRVAIAVEDNGPGIDEDERDLVFRPFLKLKEAKGSEGVGAGLAIVQRIVSVHGGSVYVEDGSSLGGARFVLQLPRPGTLDTLGLSV